jgi:uncharacterized protein (DUF952 family)
LTHYRSAAESREAGVTYHLVPVPVWDAASGEATYVPEAYDADGFIHCTNGIDEIVAVGNLFYQGDPRPFQVLALDVDQIEAEVRYDAPGEVYPHIYGPLNASAVIATYSVIRDDAGRFLDVESGD